MYSKLGILKHSSSMNISAQLDIHVVPAYTATRDSICGAQTKRELNILHGTGSQVIVDI